MTDFEKTFDNAAGDYDRSRPDYVKEIYDTLFAYKPLHSDSNVLEIGMGTGKAAGPILAAGCRFTGIEPGKQLADLAKERFKEYPNLILRNQTLQEFESPAETFDLIYAAAAFHWIPEEYGYKRVYELLKSGGVFARFAYHAGADKGRIRLAGEIQELYQKYMHTERPPKEFGKENAERLADTAIQYGFTDTKYKLYHCTKDYTANEYGLLLKTYPDHMALAEDNRTKLFEGIHEAITKHGGMITVYYTMDLELARKI